MKLGALGTAGRELRALFDGGATAGLADGELLARFAAGPADAGSEAAFAALVARHGPMVWGTCRRILRDPHAAEDAFQATFLLLVRKAGSIRVDDSLGRWLHGAGVRVALRARASARRRVDGDLATIDLLVTPPPPDADLRAAIDEEVDRLPPAYRSVVVLCHLEGLTREHAASTLGCPVGTVNSRLSRAGGLLKSRLTRRGLAPASAALSAWLTAPEASAAVPPKLAGATVAASTRIASGGALAGTVTAGVAVLLDGVLRRMALMTLMKTTAFGSTLIALAAFVAGAGDPARPAGEPPRSDDPPQAAKPAEPPPKPPTPSEQFRSIEAEWKAALEKFSAEMGKGKTQAERDAIFPKFYPDEMDYFRRCLELADAHPKDPGARDALLWVVGEGMRNNDATGPRMVPTGKAAEALVRDFADDPRVARAALRIDNAPSANRGAFARALREKATGREAKGLATLALAQYLGMEADIIHFARTNPVQPKSKYQMRDDEGKPYIKEGPESYADSYWQWLRSRDEAATRAESEALYHRVIAEFADVVHNPMHYEGGKLVKNPSPKTLAQVAEAKLDDLRNLVVGNPAPEIEGPDLDDRPLKLSDHRGKVVVLAFWGSWCGPCMAAIPQERELARRLQGKPFVLLGVNAREKPEAARKAVRDAAITWPSWHDGEEGGIVDRYHIRSFPTVFVIDARGNIRSKEAGGEGLDKFVDQLLAEIEPKPADPE